MESPIQDDPYQVLGISKLAGAADIKSAYRKLALKCHPDKVADETLKQAAADNFHRIQQAYEILSDDEKRSRYDARVRLAELKAEMMRRDGGRGGPTKGSVYDSRPSFSRSATYEVRVPKGYEDYAPDPRASTRSKHADSAAYVRRSSPQTVKPEKERRSDKDRSERRRARDTEARESRDRKYYSDDVDDRGRMEEERRKRDEVVKQREREEAARRIYAAQVEEANRRAMDARKEEARRVEEARRAEETQRKAASSAYDLKYEEALRYQSTANLNTRPRMTRTESSSHYDVKRSRADGTRTRKRSPDVVFEEPPSFAHARTSPDKLREMAGERMPSRSYTENITTAHAQQPPMRRADTMPAATAQPTPSSSRRKHSDSGPSSKARHPEPVTPIVDSGYSSPSPVSPAAAYPPGHHPNIPAAQASTTNIPRTTTYHYPTASPVADAYGAASAYKTEVRTPKEESRSSKDRDRERRRAAREAEAMPAGVRTVPASSMAHAMRESPVRTSSYSHRSPDEERARESERRDRRERGNRREMEYGELASDYTRKHKLQPKSYEKDEVNMGRNYGYDDVKFSRAESYMKSGRERDRDSGRDRGYERYDRPTLGRSATYGFA